MAKWRFSILSILIFFAGIASWLAVGRFAEMNFGNKAYAIMQIVPLIVIAKLYRRVLRNRRNEYPISVMLAGVTMILIYVVIMLLSGRTVRYFN
jgi:uncharacterized membrane protein YiaA